MKPKCLLVVIVVCFLAACSLQEQKSKAVLSQKEFASLLADLSLQEAYIAQLPQMDSVAVADLSQRSTNILQKHKLTREQFIANFNYYQAHKEEFLQVYDSAMSQLKVVQDSLVKAGK